VCAATSRVSEVRVTGPLAGFAAGFKSRLSEVVYTPLSTVNQMRLMGHLSGWLDAGGLVAGELTEERAKEYPVFRRPAGRTGLRSRQALRLPR